MRILRPNKKIVLATIGYIILTFAIAVIWHIVVFEKTYNELGYFEGEPNFILGLLSILIQGFVLSAFYDYLKSRLKISAETFVIPFGLFFWTSHVLAFIAKQIIVHPVQFITMESIYLIIQFGLYALLLKIIYRTKS